MNLVKTLSFVPALVAALAVPAIAQDTSAGTPPAHYLIGLGGASVNLDFEHPSTTLAIEYGERLHDDVQAYANVGFVSNLMSDVMRDHLVTAGDLIGGEYTGRDRGLTFSLGGRFLWPSDMRFRPYVGGGFGLLNLKRRISERQFGDVSEFFYEATGLNDGVIDASRTSVTKPLGEVMLGAAGTFGRTYVDVAYRYRHAFHAQPVKFSQVTFGIGVAFP
jgi:hypothetical protein